VDEDDVATPRWVKVSGGIAVVLLALFVAAHVMFGGMRSHMPPPITRDGGRAP